MQQEPKCTLANAELIEKVKEWNINLAKSGGKSWMLTIPADHNEDPDLLIGELITRFKAMLKLGGKSAGTWVKASEQTPDNKDYADTIEGMKLTPEGELISRIIENWGNRIAMPQMEVWIKEYGDGRACITKAPDNKDREIAFHKWVTENEYKLNFRAQITHSIEYLHEIWEQSLTVKP